MPSADFYRLPTKEKMLNLSGVPIQYLKKKIESNKFNFCKVTTTENNKPVVVNTVAQESFLKSLLENISEFGEAYLLAVGVWPTESAGLDLLTFLSRAYYDGVVKTKPIPNIKWFDLAVPDYEYIKSYQNEEGFFCFYGVNDSSNPYRVEIAKDFLRRTADTTRVLLIQTPNILEFVKNRLGCEPDAVLQLGKTSHKTVV